MGKTVQHPGIKELIDKHAHLDKKDMGKIIVKLGMAVGKAVESELRESLGCGSLFQTAVFQKGLKHLLGIQVGESFYDKKSTKASCVKSGWKEEKRDPLGILPTKIDVPDDSPFTKEQLRSAITKSIDVVLSRDYEIGSPSVTHDETSKNKNKA